MSLTPQQIEENYKLYKDLLIKVGFTGSKGQTKVPKPLLEWMDGSDLKVAPASSNPDFHGCYPGGLVQHSLNVYALLETKVDFWDVNIDGVSTVVMALLHDLCKVNLYQIDEEPCTTPQKNYLLDLLKAKKIMATPLMTKSKGNAGMMIKWLKEGGEKPELAETSYKHVEDFPLGHSDKSVYLAMKYGVELNLVEALAIRWHMGSFDPAFKGDGRDLNAAFNTHPIIRLLHLADQEATMGEQFFNNWDVIKYIKSMEG